VDSHLCELRVRKNSVRKNSSTRFLHNEKVFPAC
jgi:hypothetical protein